MSIYKGNWRWLQVGVLLISWACCHGGEWRSQEQIPEAMRRGNMRITFTTNRTTENFYAARCTIYRGGPYDGYDQRQVYAMSYISPTDYFWHARLWTDWYARGTKRPLEGSGMEWILNMDKHYPELQKALVKNPDGSDKIIRLGTPTERKVGCRNNPLWQEYRRNDLIYIFCGSKPFEGKNLKYFSSLPEKSPADEIRYIFIDNAGIIPCVCAICSAETQKLQAEWITHGGDVATVKNYLNALVPARFNNFLHRTAHEYGRYMMPNYTSGCNFANLTQAMIAPPDSICWELTYLHAPWGRCAPYYKRGLAASGGAANSAVCHNYPLPSVGLDAMPICIPDFTRMALAEGLATQGSYISKDELTGELYPAVRDYNFFNLIHKDLYMNAMPNGRIALLTAVRSGLLANKNDSVYDRLTNRLMRMGLPIEVIVEDDLNEKLRERFDLIIAPATECVLPEMLNALQAFVAKGGGMLLGETFGSKNWYGGKAVNPVTADLLKKARDNQRGLRILPQFGDNLSAAKLMKLIREGVGNAPMRRLTVIDADADYIVNSLTQPLLKLDSYHIVNYNYKVLPFVLLNTPEQRIYREISCSNPDKTGDLYCYGENLNGPAEVEVFLKERKIGEFKANKRGWHRIPLRNVRLATGVNRFELRLKNRMAGAFAVYFDSLKPGTSGYLDAKTGKYVHDLLPALPGTQSGGLTLCLAAKPPTGSPLRADLVPLTSPVMELPGYDQSVKAAIITPDGESRMLVPTPTGSGISVTLPDVRVYSVLLVSKDEQLLEKMVKRSNVNRDAFANVVSRPLLQNALSAYNGNFQELLLSRSKPVALPVAFPAVAGGDAALPVMLRKGLTTAGAEMDGFFAQPGYTYAVSPPAPVGNLNFISIFNRTYGVTPFTVMSQATPQPRKWEFRNGMLNRGKEYAGDLHVYGQALGDGCRLSIKCNGKKIGILDVAVSDSPHYARFDLKKVKLRKGINRFELEIENGAFALAIDPVGSAFSACGDNDLDLAPDLPGDQRGAYVMAVSSVVPRPASRKCDFLPLRGGCFTLAGSTTATRTAALLTPESPAILLEAKSMPDSWAFDLPEIRSSAVLIPANDAGELAGIMAAHDRNFNAAQGLISLRDARMMIKAFAGTHIKVAEYLASSCHPHPRYAIKKFNTNGRGHWIDGTPNKFPDWMEARLETPSRINRVDLEFPSADTVCPKYEIEIFDEEVGNWVTVAKIKGRKALNQRIEFPEVITSRVRFIVKDGSQRYSVIKSFQVCGNAK